MTQLLADVIKNYPPISWKLPGMRPLQVGLILSVLATSLAGILSNPLFTLANSSIAKTPMLNSALVKTVEANSVASQLDFSLPSKN